MYKPLGAFYQTGQQQKNAVFPKLVLLECDVGGMWAVPSTIGKGDERKG